MQHVYEEKTLADCLTIKVVTDENPHNPREWGNAATLVCWSRRYTLGDEQPDTDPSEWLDEYKAANPDALIMPIYKYEHSGIALSTASFDCRWDSGQVGYAVMSAAKIALGWPLSDMHPTPEAQRAAAAACIEAEIETYSAYLNGDVYGYQVLDSEGKLQTSCYGFYSTEEAMAAGEDEAQALLPEAQNQAQARAAAERVRDAAPAMLAALQNALQHFLPLQGTLPKSHATTIALVMMQDAVNNATGAPSITA